MAETQNESEDRPEQETEDIALERSKLETPHIDTSAKIQSPSTPKTPHTKEGLLNLEESNALSQFLDSLIVKPEDSFGRIDEELQKLNESLGLPRRASDHDYDSYARDENIDRKAAFQRGENNAYTPQQSHYTQTNQQSLQYSQLHDYQTEQPKQFRSNNSRDFSYEQRARHSGMVDPQNYRYNNIPHQQGPEHMVSFYQPLAHPHTLHHYPPNHHHIAHQYTSRSPQHIQHQIPHQVHQQLPHHIHPQVHASTPHTQIHHHAPQPLPVHLSPHMVPGIMQPPVVIGNNGQPIYTAQSNTSNDSAQSYVTSTPIVDARKQREDNSRQKHMNNEKKRRALINGLYHTMCNMLPGEMTNLLPKSTVLQNAYYHMKSLEERNQALRKKLIDNGVNCDNIPEHRLDKVPESMIEHWTQDDDLAEK